MTEEERKLMISYLEDMKEEYVEGEGNEKYPLPEWYMLDKVIKIIEQQPSENEEIIKVSKGAVKARTGRFVVYDAKWLKEHFNTTEAKIYGQPKTGYWISLDTGRPSPLKDGIATESVKCSKCDEWLTASDEYATYGIYCPKCGSYNGGGTKRIDKHKPESEDKE